MRALIVNDAGEQIPEEFLAVWVRDIARELAQRQILPAGAEGKEISLVFLKEVDAKLLNWNYRQKDYATDVLSFETEDPDSLGELVLCPPVLHKQAKENKVTFEREVGYMILHGILHLLGYDHEESEEKAREMFRLQDGIFAVLTAPPAKKKPSPSAKPKKVEKAAPAKKAPPKTTKPVAKAAPKPAKTAPRKPAKGKKAKKK